MKPRHTATRSSTNFFHKAMTNAQWSNDHAAADHLPRLTSPNEIGDRRDRSAETCVRVEMMLKLACLGALLVGANAAVEAADHGGGTPLHRAASTGTFRLLRGHFLGCFSPCLRCFGAILIFFGSC